MKHVRLTIQAPDGAVHPVFDMLTRSEHVEAVGALDWNVSGDRLGILHYVEGDRDGYVDALDSIDAVVDHDVAAAGDDAFYAYHQCVVDRGAKKLFAAFTEGSMLLVPPIEFGDGGASTLSLFGDGAEIQAAIDALPPAIEVEVHEIGGFGDAPALDDAVVSDRQREAVCAALELGYYEIPRAASHEDVAAAIDCAPSTAAEHLRKAEAKVLQSVFD